MRHHLARLGLLSVLCALFMGWSVADAAAQAPVLCGIGDFVWFDANQNGRRDFEENDQGINGVVLELRDSEGTLIDTQTTSDGTGSLAGSYFFVFECAPGDYTVTIVDGVPAGYLPTLAEVGSDPTRDSSTSPATVVIELGPGQKRPDVDFGFIPGCAGSIGDRVWNDTNANGIQDGDELGGIGGVTLQLLDSDGNVVATTVSDEDGQYLFEGVCAGDYSVEVVTPSNFDPSPQFVGDPALDSNSSPAVLSLASNEHNPTIDFGFYPQCTGSIGDRVWFDANINGIQDVGELGELGIAGVTLELLDGDGNVVGTTISGGDGNYLFEDVCAGNYSVRVVSATLPDGFLATQTSAPDSTPEDDSNGSPAAVTLGTNDASDLTIDFGYYTPPPCTGSIGDFVWNDLNGNGIQDGGEPGIPGVDVTLRDGDGIVVAVDTTNANGAYLFEGLCRGDYVVELNPATLPDGMVASPANQGGGEEDQDAVDSDGIDHAAAVSLPEDDTTDVTIDFGYYRKTLLQIVKLTNGTDNNAPTGPSVTVGDDVTWTYYVTSAGSSEPLRDIVVVDDNGTPDDTADDFVPLYNHGDANNNGLLDVGETWHYVATGTATAGQYVNRATVTGTGSLSGTPVGDSDLDHYYGSEPPPTGVGRFTGGGKLIAGGDGYQGSVTYGLTIHCDRLLSNNLEVNWGRGRNSNQFHMTDHSATVACTDDPAIVQQPPVAPLDTLIGIGTGRYNNVDGFTIEFTLKDYGEPGSKDRIALKIFETAHPANVVLDVPLQGVVGGNLQAHYDQPHK